MPPSSSGRAALEALATFKKAVQGVKLKKNEGRAGDGDAVFPVEVRMPITSSSLPAEAEAFDLPLPATLLAFVALRGEEEGEESNLSISIASFGCEGLSQKVLDRAAAGLRRAVSSLPPSSSLSLSALPAAAGAALFAAVQSLAEIEPYESVDHASGATVRRFAVVREEVKVVVEEAGPPEAAVLRDPKPTPRVPFLPQKSAATSPAEAEMRFLERRFGSSLSVLGEEEEGANAKEGNRSGEQQRRRRRRRFRVSGFTPSDPSWRAGPVSLLGTFDLASYPAPGSFSLFAEVEGEEGDEGGKGGNGSGSNSSVAAARLTLALRRAAAASAACTSSPSASGGGGGGGQALRSLVRLADSRGGELSAAPEFSLDDEDDDDEAESDDGDSGGEEGSSSSDLNGSSSSSSDTESGSENESEEEREKASASPSSSSFSSSTTSGSRFALSLASLSLDGVEALSPASLTLELSCLRCSAVVLPPALSPSGLSSAASSLLRECGTCRAPLSLALQSRVAHASSSAVAVVRCLGCVPRDLLLPSSSFGAQCERCSRVAALRGAASANSGGGGAGGGGRSNFALRRPCPSCHAALAVLFEGCAFDRMPESGGRGSGGGGGGGAGTRRRKSRRASGGDDGGGPEAKAGGGAPLPRHGACDHYPHSRRVMRFPCCGRVFPCDVCHELSAASDPRHAPEVVSVATRMTCGFCSKEQAFEKKGEPAICRGCGKHLAGSSRYGEHGRTRHWEGGKGCRDPKMLDRRDSKKHAGSRLKARSKKAFRVGAAKKKQQKM